MGEKTLMRIYIKEPFVKQFDTLSLQSKKALLKLLNNYYFGSRRQKRKIIIVIIKIIFESFYLDMYRDSIYREKFIFYNTNIYFFSMVRGRRKEF